MTVRTCPDVPSTRIFTTCFEEFGFYVNKTGEPNLTKGTIEWEGTAEHVAWHPP